MSTGMAGAPCRYIYLIATKASAAARRTRHQAGTRPHRARRLQTRRSVRSYRRRHGCASAALLRDDRKHNRQARAHGAEYRREQLRPAVAGRELPAAAGVAPIAVERDALAGDRAAIKIERNREIERDRAEKRSEALEREEHLHGGAEDDAALMVLADEAAVGERAWICLDAARAVARHQQREGAHRILVVAQCDMPLQSGEVADADRTGRGDEGAVIGNVVPRPEPRARAHDRGIGRAVAGEIAAVDHERGAKLSHPGIEIAIARRHIAHGETEMRRLDAREQDAIDLAALGDDRKLGHVESGCDGAPGERPGRDGAGG